jgi:predicted amidohydrolase
MGDTFPKFKAAAIQAAPVFLNREATVEKACRLILEAANRGAQLIVFPEVFIAGYPYWHRLDNPFRGKKYFRELVKNAVEVPSPATEKLCHCARQANAIVVMGINEKIPETLGTIFNSNLIIDRQGKIIGCHRKLVPTFIEKLTWGGGDGCSLCVYDTDCGKVGTLICGENLNPLARFALLAQGEQVHAANYPGQPAGDESNHDIRHTIEIRSAAQSFEGKVFTIAACGVFTQEIADLLGDTEEKKRMVTKGSIGLSGIFGPNGKFLAGPLDPNEEGMVIAEIDIEQIIEAKLHHDIAGNYNRFDVLSLNINRSPQTAIWEMPGDESSSDSETLEEIKSRLDKLEAKIRALSPDTEKR